MSEDEDDAVADEDSCDDASVPLKVALPCSKYPPMNL
eukprot:COSAG05_NODE_358_length_10812_cov_90.986372_6_plen_37_part_00